MALALPSANVVTADGIDAAGVQANFERLAQATASLSATSGVVGLPPGLIFPFGGATAPDGYLLCAGQSLSTTTYASLFAAIAYTHGGSGASFSLPDLRGRTIAGKDDMGGTAASRITVGVSGITGTTLGNAGGGQNVHLHNHTQDSHNHTQNSHNHTQDSHNHTQNQHQHTGSVSASVPYAYTNGSASTVTTTGSATRVNSVSYSTPTGSFTTANVTATNVANTATNQAQTATNIATTATNQSFGTGTSQNVQPTIILNYIIKT